jgi:hypothetical protein
MSVFGIKQHVLVSCPTLAPAGFPIGGQFLDVSISEDHAIERTLTKYPVEFGGQVSDHLLVTPRRLSVTGFLTDAPSDPVEAVEEALRNTQRAFAQTTGAPVTGPLASTRSKDIFAIFELLAASSAICSVATELTVYESMILTRLGVPRSTSDGRGLTVELVFDRLTVAKTSTRAGLKIDEPAAPSPVAAKKIAKQQTKPVAKQQTSPVAKESTNAFDILSWFR